MIVGSDVEMTIGKRDMGVFDNDGVLHREQPYTVLRRATREEFIAEAKAEADGGPLPSTILVSLARARCFYEIAID